MISTTVFDDPAGGTQAMRYYVGQMPDKRTTSNEQDFPFCLITPGEFTFARDGRKQSVNIQIGLYEAGSKGDALTAIDAFMTLIADAANKSYSGYKLIGEFSGSMTTENYPYFEINLSGEFKKSR